MCVNVFPLTFPKNNFPLSFLQIIPLRITWKYSVVSKVVIVMEKFFFKDFCLRFYIRLRGKKPSGRWRTLPVSLVSKALEDAI